MKIHTLTTDCTLYLVHRNKWHYKAQLERRRAFRFTCAIVACVAIALYILIIYR